MVATRSDVARLAGVSTAVVSYVVNNGPRPVSEKSRRAVEDAIRELNYRPNVMARALKGGTSGSVGLLLPEQSNPYFAELAQAVERELSEEETLVLTGTIGRSSERSRRYIDLLVERRVDAIIAIGGGALEEQLSQLRSVSVAFIDRAGHVGGRAFSVSTLGAEGAMRAAEHLQFHGHRHIGCVAGPPGVTVADDRVTGWRRAVGDESRDLVAYGDFTAAGGDRAAESLLAETGHRAAAHRPRPTALFVSSDVQAMGVIHACDRLGLRVPDDVAIVSFDGTRAGAFVQPSLTSLRQPVDAMAREIAAFLRSGTPADMRLDGQLVIRHSCGCDG